MSIDFKIPERLPEANVQAEFYLRCKQEGISCLLEYKVKGSRFDAVIHKGDKLICLVEVKNLREKALKNRIKGERKYRQIERYKTFGYPLFCVWTADFIEPVIQEIKSLLGEVQYEGA